MVVHQESEEVDLKQTTQTSPLSEQIVGQISVIQMHLFQTGQIFNEIRIDCQCISEVEVLQLHQVDYRRVFEIVSQELFNGGFIAEDQSQEVPWEV